MIILPICEQITSLIMAWIEYFKAKISLKITSINCEIGKITEANEPTVSYPIGFQMPTEECEEYYEE